MGTTLLGLPIALLVVGFPIFLVFLVASIATLSIYMRVPPTVVIQTLFGSLDTFPLLAVPFFIFAGELMGRGGISRRLIAWFLAMLGSIRGSLGFVTVASCEFFGAISGSSPATVAAIGRLMYPALIQGKYGERFSLGLITASGAIAILIPPSISMVLYGISAEVSIADLFMAGILPGLLVGVCLSAYILYYSIKNDIPRAGNFVIGDFVRTTIDAVPALGLPAIILGGIYFGIFTPTEAAGVACVYGILVGTLLYREMSFKDVFQIAVGAGTLTAQILIIAAASGVFSWLLTVGGIPQASTAFIQSLDLPPVAILLTINVLLLIVGCLIDPVSSILVLTPLLVPIARAVGVDPVHFGVIMTANLAIGMFTPPFGLNIFISQALFKQPAGKIIQGIVPFLVMNLIALAAITYIPEISLAIPSLMR